MATTTTSSPNSLLFHHSTTSRKPSSLRLYTSSRVSLRRISCTAVSSPPPSVSSSASSTGRLFNFAAGPATLPESVILEAQAELFNYQGSGMSIMEMSHRSKEFDYVIKKAESDLRSLLSISDDYSVLFLQGGATTQFAAAPLNLCASPDTTVDYIVTGSWGDKAFKEAQKYCKPNLIWSGKAEKYTKIPCFDSLQQSPDARYLHICANETIHGVEFKDYPTPANKDSVLVADMSSNFCSKPVDVSRFGLIYAGAQKNVGPSGVTVVIVRKDLIGNAQPITPVMLDYKTHADTLSLYNTPPCFAIYICSLVFADLLKQGGLVESVRSLMNVPFTLRRPELEKTFIAEASKEGMVQLKGHRSVGGMRASIYNAMPLAGVEKLVAFMKDFQARNP
ncbi:hypothetical protein LUZ63_018765 [Rhynchospora breviuscula]|uniref:phosphoserine transaminase n=1 Tax=Rhynchospora breviuscula TaxID=2022672 RepID=A0A9Q0HJ31_9POAL|nr:hypothetical protein LUZ63_018765 [Rhynchospora breviuscula]